MATGVWLESHFNATAAASFNTKALQSQPKARLQFPEWCDAPLDGFAGEWLASYACESYLASPIQGTIFIADVVAVWFIIAIMYRWFQQEQTRRKTRAKIALAVRGRRNWAVLAAVIRLASCAAESRGPSKLGKLSGNLGPLPNGQAKWSECWRRVISLRADRKSDLVKIDFHLFGVMMRSSGRMLVLAMTLLILFEIRSFFQVVVPGIVGPWPVRYLVKCIGLVLSVRIFFDYARSPSLILVNLHMSLLLRRMMQIWSMKKFASSQNGVESAKQGSLSDATIAKYANAVWRNGPPLPFYQQLCWHRQP